MNNAAIHNYGISVSSSLHNTAATPTKPSNLESALTICGSTRAHPRTRASNVTALDPRTTGSLTLPQRAYHTAIPELEGQSRQEDEDLRLPSTRTCQEPPVPSSTSATPCGGHEPQKAVSSSHAMNATYGYPLRASVTPRLHMRKRGSRRYSSASLSSTPRDSLSK